MLGKSAQTIWAASGVNASPKTARNLMQKESKNSRECGYLEKQVC